eukprot:TRINITY_DN19311_c0_g2_i1.p2 TRINITY_DN19311_c0_g2~~TRINITY_DN19311_c0_g2_i1.p2  ORF type:complete len:203 (+),score=16.22 TRINITY_DN19311_c0_g2_i1:83-691(+)
MKVYGLAFVSRLLSLNKSGRRRVKRQAQSQAQQQNVNIKHLNGVLKAGVTSGSLSALGDCIAQVIQRQERDYEWQRTLRMFGFGFLFYGPYQYWWYRALDMWFPTHTTSSFLAKVALNQTVLGPIVVGTIFIWTLSLTGKWSEIPQKLERDLAKTVMNGWKFWVPAACINFYVIPLTWRVFYMSWCGVVWAAYLSVVSQKAS